MTHEWECNGSQITVCLAVKLLSQLMEAQSKKDGYTCKRRPCILCQMRQIIHAVMNLDNQSTSTSSLRQLWGQQCAHGSVWQQKVSGQTLWSGTTPCQQPLSDSCCCLTNLHTWKTSPQSKADSWDMTRKKQHKDLCAPSLQLHMEQAVLFNGLSDERCNCRSQGQQTGRS